MADFQSTGAHLLPQLEELLRQGIPQDIPQELVDLLAQGDLPRDGDERVLSYIQLLTANGDFPLPMNPHHGTTSSSCSVAINSPRNSDTNTSASKDRV